MARNIFFVSRVLINKPLTMVDLEVGFIVARPSVDFVSF
jgi:hypothetical protein